MSEQMIPARAALAFLEEAIAVQRKEARFYADCGDYARAAVSGAKADGMLAAASWITAASTKEAS